jgi:anaerobic magnesium-protoporphyrin IX monomethyl ester cyclase
MKKTFEERFSATNLRRLAKKVFLALPHSHLLLPVAQSACRHLQKQGRSIDLFINSARSFGTATTDGTTQSKYKDGPVVLISQDIAFTFPLSYAYLAGYLREQGEDVRILFRGGNPHKLVSHIMELKPVVVGFGNLYPELEEIAYLIKLLNFAGRQFPIVIGGQMVSPTPEFAVTITGADYGVIGEGEITLYQLVKVLRSGQDAFNIRGLVIRQKEDVLNTGPGEFIEDLSKLPAVPYDMFPEEKWLHIGRWFAKNRPQPHWREEDRVINIHGGRGCPFTCNFCYHHSKPRYRAIEPMMAEAATALERYNGNMLYFSDDLVLANPKRTRELVDALQRLDRRIEYSVSARFDVLARIDDSLLRQMKQSGCRIMGLGIESGSDRILNIIGKNCTTRNIREQLERLKDVGILPTVSIMVGQLTETKEDVEASIKLMRDSIRSNPSIQYGFSITTPFPGSPLYGLIFEKGYLQSDLEFYRRYFAGSEWNQVVNLSAMNDQEVMYMYKKITVAYAEEKSKHFKVFS